MKNLKIILAILVAIVVAMYASKVLPPYFANFQFQDALETEVKFDAYNTKTEDDIRATVLKKAKELSIPVTVEQIHVTKANGEVNIWMDYSVHIGMPSPLQSLDLTFHPAAKNTRI